MGACWAVMYWLRKDLRKAMVWSGIFYIAFLSVGFVAYRILFDDPVRSITPGYWAPPTLFDLGQKTGGYAIEDAIFMFFAGGTAAALYDFCFRKRFSRRDRVAKPKKRYVFVVGVLAAGIFHSLFYLNDIYLLILFNLFGALVIMWQRRDLIKPSLYAGLLYLALYGLQFFGFNALFPNFIDQYYNLQATSGAMILGVPLEELLYAGTFGMIWGLLYKYAKGITYKREESTDDNKVVQLKIGTKDDQRVE